MQAALKLTATVQPGGRIEIRDSQLIDGDAVDVIVLLRRETEAPSRSVVDVLAEAPGHITFQTAEQVDSYLLEERASWEH